MKKWTLNTTNAIQQWKSLLGGCHYCGMVINSWNMSVSPALLSSIILLSENEDDQVQEVQVQHCSDDQALTRERYYDCIATILCKPLVVLHKGGIERCEGWAQFYADFVLWVIDNNLSNMTEFKALIRLIKECRHCVITVEKWLQRDD